MTASELYAYLNTRYPIGLRAAWDHDGACCLPEPERVVKKVLLTLDVTDKAVKEAIATGCDGIIAHHPLLFKPLSEVTESEGHGRKLLSLIRGGLFCFCFHTRLDAVKGGVNDCLAEALELFDITPLELDGIPMGRIGYLPIAVSERELALYCKKKLSCAEVTYAPVGKNVRKIALLGGAGGDALRAAKDAGADALVTGDIHYNPMLDAAEDGLAVYRCGHFETENPVLDELVRALAEVDASIETVRFSSLPTETV